MTTESRGAPRSASVGSMDGVKDSRRAYSIVLGALAFAFLARVLGQLFAAAWSPSFLPPMQEWHSGLLPYRALLPIQLAILAFQFEASRQLWRGCGWIVRPHPRLGAGLKWFSLAYFLAMLIRYVITMALFPERRWFEGSIPILFHWVLAAYLLLLSRHHRGIRLSPRG